MPFREALCNCGCTGEANFVACWNTAKTTVGVSTFSRDPFSAGKRWKTTALRIFGAGSDNINGSRKNTNFFESGDIPDGPGGQVFFEVAYLQDLEPRIVRGFTGPVSCASRSLCEKQCAGQPQFESWSIKCNATASSGGANVPGNTAHHHHSHREMSAAVWIIGAVALLAMLWFIIRPLMNKCKAEVDRTPPHQRFSANSGSTLGGPQPISAQSL